MLSKKEMLLAAHFLEDLTSFYGNSCCNDVKEEIWNGWTKEERQKFVKEFHDYNGDAENYDSEELNLPDFAIVGFLAHKITHGTDESTIKKETNEI